MIHKKYNRAAMFEEAKELGLEHKCNISNIKLDEMITAFKESDEGKAKLAEITVKKAMQDVSGVDRVKEVESEAIPAPQSEVDRVSDKQVEEEEIPPLYVRRSFYSPVLALVVPQGHYQAKTKAIFDEVKKKAILLSDYHKEVAGDNVLQVIEDSKGEEDKDTTGLKDQLDIELEVL